MYHYIAIERQFGSGGQEIARELAKRLGYKLCDHNILVETSKIMNLPAVYISDLEEKASGGALLNLAQHTLSSNGKKNVPLSEQIYQTEKQIILREAADSNCIFVGRCAGKALEDLDGSILRVFIYADMDYRTKRAENVEKISKDKIASEIKRMDKRRADFFNEHSGSRWGSQDFFQISLNSGVLGVDRCVDILMAAVGK